MVYLKCKNICGVLQGEASFQLLAMRSVVHDVPPYKGKHVTRGFDGRLLLGDSDLLAALMYLLGQPVAKLEDANRIVKDITQAPHIDTTHQWTNLQVLQVRPPPSPRPLHQSWQKRRQNANDMKC